MKKKSPPGTCSSCAHGKSVIVNDDICCQINGIVSGTYHCKKYKMNDNLNCCSCANFRSTSSETSSQGFCAIFTVREYDGESKKICSKFSFQTITSA